ncbi:MAG: pyrroline-5-carboxylate reductase [Candidatus Omnitrophica bacterium]|nr:pyrroline-5-carboxylate reductase [Candidatus Omnitrophota bacterium]
MNDTVGIIGFGNMGLAIAERLKSNYPLIVFDKDKEKLKVAKGITIAKNIAELLSKSVALILAVKPQDFAPVLREMKGKAQENLVISIAAGISTGNIEKALGDVRVIRSMPNLGAKIGESVTCVCKGRFADDSDLEFADELFGQIGCTRNIDESMMDAATAISGSGPGYIFDYLDKEKIDPKNIPEHTRFTLRMRLEKAAEAVGFNREDAVYLATNTANACMIVVAKVGISAAELRSQVASKGGTTEAGLAVINKGGTWEEAAQAALKRAKELSKGN